MDSNYRRLRIWLARQDPPRTFGWLANEIGISSAQLSRVLGRSRPMTPEVRKSIHRVTKLWLQQTVSDVEAVA